MITREQYELLCRDDVRGDIDRCIDRDPIETALDKRLPHAAEVASQVKYLQRARRKLPEWYRARCIMPALAFEQSSSCDCAAHKEPEGETALDLTCGLGVDSFYLSKRFAHVTAVERDPVLADVARENFRRLGADNIEVVCASAEEFIARTEGHYDWCYADPDRRGPHGEKLVRLEECSPDITALMPAIRRRADRVCIKASPMFDIDEAFRIFGQCRVEAVSLGDECKEVLVYIDGSGPSVTATALGRGSFTVPRDGSPEPAAPASFRREEYVRLLIPDVALQKTRLARRYLDGRADIWSDNGYGFATAEADTPLCRQEEIASIERYDPRKLRREMKGRGIEILKREFPVATHRIAAALGVREGGGERVAFTSVGGEFLVIRLK